MAPGPTDLEAWTALQAYAPELDKIRRPKELKEAMHDFVAQNWDMSQLRLDFVDFGVIWIDPHYRRICNKFTEIGPGRETFNIATYRTLKTSRLEGHWDVLLDNLADWIKSFAKEFRASVTLNDFEMLLACMPKNVNLKTYRQNVKNLFWQGTGTVLRMEGFLAQLPQNAYEYAFNVVLANPPDIDWNLKLIMTQIHDKGIVCKSVMLHVGFWFNPHLEEPANRANVKPSMFYHLKPAFSKYVHGHPLYASDESWKTDALVLQRVVVDFTLEWWPRSQAIVGNLGMLRDISYARYSDYISNFFWNSLIRQVRSYTKVPFAHPSLQHFKTIDDVPPNPPGPDTPAEEAELSKFRGQVGNIIRDEYSDGHSVETDEDRNSLDDGENSALISQHNGRDGSRYLHTNSATSEALAVESDGEQDVIHVRTPSPSYSNPSKKRKLQNTTEANAYVKGTNNGLGSKTVLLKAPHHHRVLNPSNKDSEEQRQHSAGSGSVSRNNSFTQIAQEPSPTVSAPSNTTPTLASIVASAEHQARVLPRSSSKRQGNQEDLTGAGRTPQELDQVMQVPQWTHIEQETARRALEEYEGNLRSRKLRISSPERRNSLPIQKSQRPRKHHLSLATNTGLRKLPTTSPVPQSFSDPVVFAPTPITAPPAFARNKTEQAIMVLQEQYGENMQIGEMLAAIRLLKNDLDAGIFLALKPGTLRNAWLENGIKDS